MFRNVGLVLLVPLGKDDRRQAGALRREYFFLEPADLEHAPSERHLTRHCDVVTDGGIRKSGGQGRRHRDACRRPVFGNGACRHVNVHIMLGEHVRVDFQPPVSRADITERRVRGFFHHVAKMAGQGQDALALHQRRLDVNDVAA